MMTLYRLKLKAQKAFDIELLTLLLKNWPFLFSAEFEKKLNKQALQVKQIHAELYAAANDYKYY